MEKVKMNIKISNKDLKEYSDSLFNSIQNDSFYPKLKEEGWSDLEIKNNVTKFKEYIDDLHLAQKIKTYEDCLKYGVTNRLILVRNGNVIERNFEPLKPYKEFTDFITRFYYADFSKDLISASFSKIYKNHQKLIAQKLRNDKWIYLKGVMNTGRSYSALSIIKRAYQKNRNLNFGFIDCQYRIKEANDLFFKNKTDFNELIESYSTLDILIFDNFGNEYKNELIRDMIVYPILQNRLANNLKTIFTSDFDLEEIRQLYTFKKGQNDIIANRLYSLLKEKTDGEIDYGNLKLY